MSGRQQPRQITLLSVSSPSDARRGRRSWRPPASSLLPAIDATDIRVEHPQAAQLPTLLGGIWFSGHLAGEGERVSAHACKLWFEDVRSKRGNRPASRAGARPRSRVKNLPSAAMKQLRPGATPSCEFPFERPPGERSGSEYMAHQEGEKCTTTKPHSTRRGRGVRCD